MKTIPKPIHTSIAWLASQVALLEDHKKTVASERIAREKVNTRSFEHSDNFDRSSRELNIQEKIRVYKTNNKSDKGEEKMTGDMQEK